MTYDRYFKECCKRFPEMNFDKIVGCGWNRVDMICKVAECLFIAGEWDGELVTETRKQLKSLRKEGVVDFK